ncbi:hypothetical protein CDAR_570641 [Caerostris darwini]|uniref:Uncharacterized protein n=1 Tax=Caerostris darwini TaxID=1538125 RepID=A0AAV4QG59_9ARAC|nr:hypothetical protein CDAR_570641 [Caerostris darwini]
MIVIVRCHFNGTIADKSYNVTHVCGKSVSGVNKTASKEDEEDAEEQQGWGGQGSLEAERGLISVTSSIKRCDADRRDGFRFVGRCLCTLFSVGMLIWESVLGKLILKNVGPRDKIVAKNYMQIKGDLPQCIFLPD